LAEGVKRLDITGRYEQVSEHLCILDLREVRHEGWMRVEPRLKHQLDGSTDVIGKTLFPSFLPAYIVSEGCELSHLSDRVTPTTAVVA